MSTKKLIGLVVATILLVGGILDGIRYLQPNAENKPYVQPQISFPVSSAKEIILVYNAWGGIYPGVVDFVHKEVFPKTYPCNLCYQTFGTFSMKKEWLQYLNRLPFKTTELHKDDFQRRYLPVDLELPVILLANEKGVQVLLSANELNTYKSLDALQVAVSKKLKP